MLKPPVAAVINFCTNEARFLQHCVEQCRFFARQIIISVCDHFFDGQPENQSLLEQIFAAFPDCRFILFPFVPREVPKWVFREMSENHFWHSAARCLSLPFLDDSIESVLFLDADEIAEGKKILSWLGSSDYEHHTVMKLANFWYFREERYQATQWEDSIVLVQKRALQPSILLQDRERDAIYDLLPGPKRRTVTASDGQPMFHHYSWVRTREEMLKKVASWGHRADRDWKALVEKEFEGPFQGRDFIHGYSFREVEPRFPVLTRESSFPEKKGPPAVIRLNGQDFIHSLALPRYSWTKKIFSYFLQSDNARSS